MKLSDLVIMTDVDGTLINRDGSIPPRNVEAINRFVDKGGRFAIATGRSPVWIRRLVEKLPVNTPCVCYNGGGLYDFAADRHLMQIPLPDHVRDFLPMLEEMPVPAAVLVMTTDSYNNIGRQMELAGKFLDMRPDERATRVDPDTITDTWMKLLFSIRKEDHSACMAFLEGCDFPGCRLVVTNYELIELLPEQSSKANALERLMEMTGIRREQLVAIGDFYNDLEMIRLAGLGATLSTSPRDIQEEAAFIAGPCEQGAVADLIEHLEGLYPA